MTTTEVSLINLECSSCVMLIEGLAEDHPGVTKAEVSLQKKILLIEHEPDCDVRGLRETLRQQGYA